jgi:hypothetical protein
MLTGQRFVVGTLLNNPPARHIGTQLSMRCGG